MHRFYKAFLKHLEGVDFGNKLKNNNRTELCTRKGVFFLDQSNGQRRRNINKAVCLRVEVSQSGGTALNFLRKLHFVLLAGDTEPTTLGDFLQNRAGQSKFLKKLVVCSLTCVKMDDGPNQAFATY